MNILLVAGSMHEVFCAQISYKKNIINKKAVFTSEALSVVKDEQVKIDKLLILDEGIDEAIEELMALRGKDSLIITRDLLIKKRYEAFEVYFEEAVRVSGRTYESIMENLLQSSRTSKKGHHFEKLLGGEGKYHKNEKRQDKRDETFGTAVTNSSFQKEEQPKKEFLSLLSKFKKSKTREDIGDDDQRFKSISSGISRVIAVTGHRGAGITSTVVNLGHEAASRGLKTIILDLDICNRTSNLYFGEFIRQVDEDEYMKASLIRCLAKPQDYKNSSCQIKSGLWLSALAYEFEDERLMNQFYTAGRLMNLITVLRQTFNVIILDMPVEKLGYFQEVIQNIDTFALCTNNSQYSIVTTLRNLDYYLTNESINILNAKAKLVITKYNDHAQYEEDFFTPDKVSEIFASDLSDAMNLRMAVAGAVRYDARFDEQIERDIPVTETDMSFKSCYSNILLRMLEGVR